MRLPAASPLAPKRSGTAVSCRWIEVTFVTVIIPARNEETAISAALASIAAQTYPTDLTEVVVVDGASTDRTRPVAEASLAETQFRRWAVIDNPTATTPSNLNAGLDWAEGDVVVRVDARSTLPPHYLARVVEILQDERVAVVGGRQSARPAKPSFASRSIARALNNPFANGGARYRDHRASSGDCETAYLGVFRTDQLRAVDGWGLDFASNQDFELCRRMAAFGSIRYEASLVVDYESRPTFRALLRQYRRFGRWKVKYWAATNDRPQRRQVVLLTLPSVGVVAGTAAAIAAPSTVAPIALLSVAGLLIVDRVGETQPASIAHRIGSATAMVLIGVGWWSGAVQEALEHRGAPTPNLS